MLRRAVSPKLFLRMCVDPFACSHLVSLWCPSLLTFTPVPARSSLGVQCLLAMASPVSLWQGHIHAAAQPPDPCQGHAWLWLPSAPPIYASVTKPGISTWICWKCGLNLDPGNSCCRESSGGSIQLCAWKQNPLERLTCLFFVGSCFEQEFLPILTSEVSPAPSCRLWCPSTQPCSHWGWWSISINSC